MNTRESSPLDLDALCAALDPTLMEWLLQEWRHLVRLSGSAGAERAVDLLVTRLEEEGIAVERLRCPLYVSDPIAASLSLPELPEELFAPKTRSFSTHCPDGIEGALFFDTRAFEALGSMDEGQWYAQVRGHIVVAENGFEDYVARLERHGALGLIHVWPSSERAVHEETVGGVWGTPQPDDRALLPRIPVIGLQREEGLRLLARCRQGTHACRARIATRVDSRVVEASLPVVTIAGRSPEFVLLSSHYDSWHEGMTDNATGNALCLAMAKLFNAERGRLARGVKIAWWPGHSNARYGGSTWYADRFRRELKAHCIAHINVDSPGCRGGEALIVNASGAEEEAFIADAVSVEQGAPPERLGTLGKGADQSFWALDIALHLALKELPAPGARTTRSPGSGGGWWWHTEADTLDKVDRDHLLRDARIHVRWLAALLDDARLPLAPLHYLDTLRSDLGALDDTSDAAFDFSTLYAALDALAPWVETLEQRWRIAPTVWQVKVMRLVGMFHRLRHSASDDYHRDPTWAHGPFPGLRPVCHCQRERSDAATFLFTETLFRRQRDRVVETLERLRGRLMRWLAAP